MKKFFIILLTIFLLGPVSSVHGYYEGEDEPPEKRSGWFLGSDQGVMFWLGDTANFFNVQYYGTLFGGYNIKGYVQPLIRFGQAIGSLKGFGNPTTYWFIIEGGARFTPLRTKIRPFFVGTGGLYVLDFSNFGSLIQTGANFTYTGGGGIQFSFGRSTLELKGQYRGFLNGGGNLQGMNVTFGYFFQF